MKDNKMTLTKADRIRKVDDLLNNFPEVIFRTVKDSEDLKELLYDRVFFETDLKVEVDKEQHEKQPKDKSKEKLITEYLWKLGMPTNIRGFKYARYAISICVDEPKKLEAITRGIYPEVAIEFATTPTRVERAIRHAIEVAWGRGSQAAVENIFGFTISEATGKPTNSEFIAFLADKIRRELDN